MLRLFFIAFVFCVADARSQTLAELRAKYPESHAVVLNYTEDTRIYLENDKPVAETKVVKEILVLDDKANGMYNKYYVYHGSFDEFINIEAYTKVPSGNGYTKIKVQEIQTASSRSKGVFYDDVKETKFDFPSLTAGAIAYISYTIIEKDGHMLTPLYMRSYMPVVKEKFTITYPSNIEFLFTVKNDAAKIISVTEDKKGRNYSTVFAAQDVKESERFGSAPAASYYEPHVIIRIGSYKNEEGKQMSFLKQLDDLYNWNYGFIKQMQEQDETEIKELSDSLTANVASEKEKARKIYQWVQQNIKYVAFENGLEGFIPRPAGLVCSRRFGDCKDMASLLTLLLKKAGIKAYFTWIGTRDIPYDYHEVPQPITDNHMISTILVDGQWIFLDGTDPNCIFGFPSGFIQGKQALVGISENKYELVRVPEVEAEKNMALDSTFISLSDKGITGRSNVSYYGYYGIDVNNAIFYKNADDTRDYVKYRMGKASNKFILNEYSIKHTDRDNKTVNIKANFEVPDYGKKIGDEWYINLNLEKFFTNNSLIDTAKRKVGIMNDYKYVIRQYAIVDIPQGYVATDVPDNFKTDNDVIGFTISYTKEKDRIVACQQFTSKTLLLTTDQFNAWNDAIRKVLAQYKKQVVLKKQ
jgi:hypothetical protein